MATAIQMARKDTWRVSLKIDNVDWGVWDIKTGGEVDSEQGTAYKPGGMEAAIALGGSVTTGNITISRACRLERDWQKIQKLIAAAGKGKVVLTQAVFDVDGNAWDQHPIVYNGKLKRITPPEVDSNSTDVATLELEIVVDGVPTPGGV